MSNLKIIMLFLVIWGVVTLCLFCGYRQGSENYRSQQASVCTACDDSADRIQCLEDDWSPDYTAGKCGPAIKGYKKEK